MVGCVILRCDEIVKLKSPIACFAKAGRVDLGADVGAICKETHML